MMHWLDSKYANLLSYQLERFKKVGNNLNFRCPLCLDSKKSRVKARGWILDKPDHAHYYCFNCGASMPFRSFLKGFNQTLYYDYIREKFSEEPKKENIFEGFLKKEVQFKTDPLSGLEPLNKKSISYLDSRKIPKECQKEIYYVPKFKEWVNSIIPNKFENLTFDDDRIVIPFYDEDKTLIGFTGRTFQRLDIKYLTIMLDEDSPKVYGLDKVNLNKKVFWVEGPLDAMFLSNGVASAGGSVETNILKTKVSKENSVVIYDNEPRKKETVNKIYKAIKKGFSVCIWPEYIKQNDINDMVLANLDPENIIRENIYKGLAAELKLAEWKKV